VLLIIATVRLVTDDTHTFRAKSVLPFIMSRRILIEAFILTFAKTRIFGLVYFEQYFDFYQN